MTATEKREIAKDEEFGYSLFGCSDIIKLFQEGKASLIENCNTYRYYASSISRFTNSQNKKHD